MSKWIELPTVFIDKPQEEIEKDLEAGIKYTDEDYELDWCCFKRKQIVAFNKGCKADESTIRLKNLDSFKIKIPYQELKAMLINDTK